MKKNLKKVLFWFKRYLVRLFKRVFLGQITIKGWHLFFLIALLFASKCIYNLSNDISMRIASWLADVPQENPIIQFVVYFLPLFFLSWLLSVVLPLFSFRVYRYYIIAVALFVETFVLKDPNPGIRFADYIGFYLAFEAFILALRPEIPKERREIMWPKRILQYVDKKLTDHLIADLKKMETKIDTHRPEINIPEISKIHKKMFELNSMINDAIMDRKFSDSQPAPEADQTILEEELEKRHID